MLSPQRARSILACSRCVPHKRKIGWNHQKPNGHYPPRSKNGCKHRFLLCCASQEVPAGPPNSHLHKRKYPSLTEEDRSPNSNEEQTGGAARVAQAQNATGTGRTEVGRQRKVPKRRGARGRCRPPRTAAPAARKLSLHRYPATVSAAATSFFHLTTASSQREQVGGRAADPGRPASSATAGPRKT